VDSDLFWYFAGALVLAAVVLAFVGLRSKGSFPATRGPLVGGIAIFAALVLATGAFAIAYAEDEQEERNAELAAEEAEAAEEEPSGGPAGTQPAPAGGGQATQPAETTPAPSAAQTLDVTSPEDGSLVFEPDGLEASAGDVTLAYDNPSPVTHNINIEDDQGQTLAESDDVTGAATEAAATLVPGEYVFYCSIPGHREAGMEGTLTVQ
jgi:plastocyanin